MIVNRKVNEDNEKINWLKIHEIKIVKEPLKLYCEIDFETDYSFINLQRKLVKGKQNSELALKKSLQLIWKIFTFNTKRCYGFL